MNQAETTPRFKKGIPFSFKIIIAVVLGLVVGISLGAGNSNSELKPLIDNLQIPTDLFFQVLTVIVVPQILLVLLYTLINNQISGKQGKKLVVLITQNTAVAILIGFLVVTILSPGTWVNLDGTSNVSVTEQSYSIWKFLFFILLVLIVLPFGFVLRRIKIEQECQGKTNIQSLEKIIKVLSKAIERILTWVIALLPVAVFGTVSKSVAEQGFMPFISFGALIVAVLLALFLQACYYLVRIKLESSVNPFDFLRKASEAFLFSFSSASSALTMPILWDILVNKIRLRENSASLGVYLGGNLSKDTFALFQTMFTLFVAQILGLSLNLEQYIILFLLSIVTSIVTIGIPSGGIVRIIFVFNTLSLPVEYIGLLLSIYWFIDMCTTVINVMGYMTLAILLDGKERQMN